jgi:hypothetical protein
MCTIEMGAAGDIKELGAGLACLQVAPVAGHIEELLALRPLCRYACALARAPHD